MELPYECVEGSDNIIGDIQNVGKFAKDSLVMSIETTDSQEELYLTSATDDDNYFKYEIEAESTVSWGSVKVDKSTGEVTVSVTRLGDFIINSVSLNK